MAIVLRANKSVPLTFEEVDGNFSELNNRLSAIEESNVSSVNGLTGTVTLSTAEITESGNLYFTTSRANAAFDTRLGTKTTSDISEGSNLYFTNARADSRIALSTGSNLDLSAKTTNDLAEGSNLYFTNSRADARIAAADIDDLANVEFASTPTLNHVLTWNGSRWVAAEAPGATGGEANTASNLNTGFEVFAQKIGVDLQFRSIEAGDNINMSQDSERITINFDPINNLAMDSNRITDLADPINDQDGATKAYVNSTIGSYSINFAADTGPLSSIDIDSNGTFTINGTTGQINTTNDGAGTVTLSLPSSLDVNVTSASALQTARTIQISGDVAGSASFDGSANINIATQVADNSVDLGTHTTGIYVADITAGTGVSVTGNTAESANVTVSIPQSIGTSDSPTFNNLVLQGNLTVNGSTTTVNTANMLVEDLLVYLGNGRTGTPSGDGGIIIERGDLNNAFIGYDESADRFVMGTGTFSSTSTGDLVVAKGTLEIGSLLLDSAASHSITTASDDLVLSPAGNISADTNRITDLVDPASAQDAATKAYVDSAITGSTTTFNISGDTGTDTVSLGETLTFTGGTNIATSVSDNEVTFSVSGTVASATSATTATQANTVATIATSANATFYPTFVDSNNVSSDYETVYTDAGISYNPSTNILTVTGEVAATATQAKYADLAEKYTADRDYAPGTVLQVSTNESYELEQYNEGFVAGVVSTQPAYLMNSELDNGIAVALVGRVPVLVAGTVSKGQTVYAQASGHASTSTGAIVGIALETKSSTDLGLVECLLKI